MFFLLSCETARQKFVHENSVRGPSTQATHTRREPLIAVQGPRIAQPVGPATVAPSHESELRCQIPQIACPSLGDALADVGTTALREQVRSFVDDCFKAEVAPSTVDRYQQILNATIKPAEQELAMRLLPLDSMKSFLALFGHLRLKRGAGLQWPYVRMVKAAIIKWHRRSNTPCIFDEWSAEMRFFLVRL